MMRSGSGCSLCGGFAGVAVTAVIEESDLMQIKRHDNVSRHRDAPALRCGDTTVALFGAQHTALHNFAGTF
jgi:hypothetical protein